MDEIEKELNIFRTLMADYYLCASYLYYKENINMMSDGDFDGVCQYLLKYLDKIPESHRKYLNKESLEAGTGYDLKYPKDIKKRIETVWR